NRFFYVFCYITNYMALPANLVSKYPAQSKFTNNTKAVFLIGLLFFIFGFVTWLNGTLIPFLKLACQLKTDTEAFFVTFSFYIAYFLLAIPSSYILKKTGFKNGMALGLLIMAIGSLIFIPAASTRNFYLFLSGLFIQGTGLALLQTASNPYISIIGPIESAAKRISIMGICNKTAGALSPLILGFIVLKGIGHLESSINNASTSIEKENLLQQLSSRIIPPYIVMAIVLLFLAVFIKRSSLPELKEETAENENVQFKTSVFQFPHFLLGVLCIFLYVGVEVMAGDAIGTYGRTIGLSLDKTRYFTTFTLIAMLVGYIIGIITIPKIISQQKGLKLSALLGIVLTILIFISSGYTAIFFIALLGLANALMWPAIFPLAISGLGKFTKIGSAYLIMGIAGGALMPLLYSYLKQNNNIGNSLAFLICILPSYAYILYYSTRGYKKGK
ncbi:MAG TPA: sugar MFS transporter, partial [Flavisolibacter sp.]|nr:sugar MFS transporter [Flavisolibacter sp.]